MKIILSKIWGFVKKVAGYLFVAVFIVGVLIAGADEMFVSKQELKDNAYRRQTFPDGNYIAEVRYVNKCTNFRNRYELTVDIEGDILKCIRFENGGYLNESHIVPQTVPDDGKVVIKNRDGCSEYSVQILSSN